MDNRFSYLIFSLLLFFIWGVIYWKRKDLRKEVLWLSIPLGVFGILAEPVYILDYWNPNTITGTIPGIEDFIYGFSVGGIAAVLAEFVLAKKHRPNRQKLRTMTLWLIVAAGLLAFYLLHFAFGFNTFLSSVILLLAGTLTINLQRPDLTKYSFVSGLVVLLVAIVVFTLTEAITPGFVKAFWTFKNVPEIVLFNVPIDDFIYHFLLGTFFGPLFEFLNDTMLVEKK